MVIYKKTRETDRENAVCSKHSFVWNTNIDYFQRFIFLFSEVACRYLINFPNIYFQIN